MTDEKNDCCVTVDLDWAPDFMLEDLRSLLHGSGLPVTFFCTHRTPAVEALIGLPGCEAGVHPNLLDARPAEEILDELRRLFPGATGVRNHALFFHSRLLPLLLDAGFRYLSNDLMFLAEGLAPWHDWSGMVRLPIYWEDDVHCLYFGERFELELLRLRTPGTKVLSFHPVHIFLNTRDMLDYEGCKGLIREPATALAWRQGGRGVRTLFLDLLHNLGDFRVASLKQAADAFAGAHPYAGQYPAFLSRSRKATTEGGRP